MKAVARNRRQGTQRTVLPRHISSAADLTTTHDQVRGGFLAQALAKTMRAVPFVEDANRLSDAPNSAELDNDVQPAPRIAAVLEIEGVQVVVIEAKDRLLHEPPRVNPDR